MPVIPPMVWTSTGPTPSIRVLVQFDFRTQASRGGGLSWDAGKEDQSTR